MVVIVKQTATKAQLDSFLQWVYEKGLKPHLSEGAGTTIIGLIGDTSKLDENLVRSMPIVEDVKRVSEPYKRTNRKLHPDDTLVSVGGAVIGEGHLTVIAGPCSVECEEQIVEVAKAVKAAGAAMLRGGAFKPRTSPYAFQGLRAEGIELLKKAREATGLPIVTEIMNIEHIPLFEDVDIIQVGARNMQNFELLKELGHLNKPVLLKRGLANTLEELLMSAEYIVAGGNPNVILCERGIRTYETATRNTLDLSAVPFLKSRSHLPVVVDPSHACGIAWMVPALAKAAVAVGADGLLIEVHNQPEKALSDGAQSLRPDEFARLMEQLRPLAELAGKKM